jgi:hypothetical protein
MVDPRGLSDKRNAKFKMLTADLLGRLALCFLAPLQEVVPSSVELGWRPVDL